MKKNFLWVAFAAITMVGCTSDEITLSDQQQEANEQGLMPVNLSLSSATASVTQTRGTGTVGDTIQAANAFRYENIYVLMMDVTAGKEWKYTDCGGTLGEQFNNTFFCRPQAGATDGVYSLEYNGFSGGAGGALKYYPMHGISDFFGYYIDDAADMKDVNGNPKVAYNADSTALVLPFTISGSQDIMVGKATNYADGPKGFSNTTARANKVPRIDMKHMLTRFTFEVVAGDNGNGNLFIDTIAVYSKAKGELKVAVNANKAPSVNYNDNESLLSLIEWDEDQESVAMALDTLSATVPTFIDGKPMLEKRDTLFIGDEGTRYNVGEALFVQPNKTEYKLALKMHQWAKVAGGGFEEQISVQNLTIRNEDKETGLLKPFDRAKSYHVVIKVYNMREIELEATLEKWENAGTIDVNTDEY